MEEISDKNGASLFVEQIHVRRLSPDFVEVDSKRAKISLPNDASGAPLNDKDVHEESLSSEVIPKHSVCKNLIEIDKSENFIFPKVRITLV